MFTFKVHYHRFSLLILVLVLSMKYSATFAKMDTEMYKTLNSFRECLGKTNTSVCFKEKALDALNATILSPNPIIVYDMASIEKNPGYSFNASEGSHLPEEPEARSIALSDVLYDKIEEFFKSRTIKFDMAPVLEDEGRGKKGNKGKGGMMMMMAVGGMACMMAQLFMGKVAFLAGTALIIAKIALFISGIVALKKMGSGGGGGETSHVVYADHGGNSGGGGGGGWHRSLSDAQNLAYRAQIPNEATGY